MSTSSFRPPPHSDLIKVSFPQEHVMLLTFNRPKALNSVNDVMSADIDAVLTWFESEPDLWVVVITGEGRIFCAGADLLEWKERQDRGETKDDQAKDAGMINGFASISRRSSSSKPIIAAVNGGAYGGGLELILNCDLVIAGEDTVFALPEVKRGVVAIQGGMPRLARIAGHQLASEMLLLGRNVSATEAATRFGFVNKVVPKTEVLRTALSWAAQIVDNSPESVQSTKKALLLGSQHGNVEEATVAHIWSQENRRAIFSENRKEGLRAFNEKRKPVWRSPAKL